MDFMDTHAYWDHPQIWNIEGGWSNVAIAPMNNTSQLLNPLKGSLLSGLSNDAVEGKPPDRDRVERLLPQRVPHRGASSSPWRPMAASRIGTGSFNSTMGWTSPGSVRMEQFRHQQPGGRPAPLPGRGAHLPPGLPEGGFPSRWWNHFRTRPSWRTA